LDGDDKTRIREELEKVHAEDFRKRGASKNERESRTNTTEKDGDTRSVTPIPLTIKREE
jgi:hypothetical protein